MSKSLLLKNMTTEQHSFVKVHAAEDGLNNMSDYVLSLIESEIELYNGALYQRLTEKLPRDVAQAFALMPVFIGGDSSDIEMFVTQVWKREVTEENMHQVKDLFTLWYSLVAPEEYSDPSPVHLAWSKWSTEQQ